jgi:hypothetical protein
MTVERRSRCRSAAGPPEGRGRVILPGRTVNIQVFDHSEVRWFTTGKLAVSGEPSQSMTASPGGNP